MVYLHNHTSIIIIIYTIMINYTMDNLIKIIPPWFVSPSAILGHDVFINRSFGCVEVGRCMDRERGLGLHTLDQRAIWDAVVWRIVEPSWVIHIHHRITPSYAAMHMDSQISQISKNALREAVLLERSWRTMSQWVSGQFQSLARHKSNIFVSLCDTFGLGALPQDPINAA